MQIAADRLRQLAATILQAAGSSAAEAEKVAARLVGANLAGHDSHGVIRVPQYVGQVADGTIVPNQNAEVVRETEVVTVLDGHFGYGQIVGEQAVQAAIGKAMRHGIAMSALRRSAHLGRLGDWAEMTAAAGLASLHFVNATGIPLRVVPHGGRDGRGTTNPIAMAVPVPGGAPVVLDFATSATAEGKVRVARNKGVAIPPDCLLDADGRPTTDPNKLYTDPPGSLVPFGGADRRPQGRRALADGRSARRRPDRGRLQPSARRHGALCQRHAVDRDRAASVRRRGGDRRRGPPLR